ncbi:hypothetical protein ACIP98_06475 [Streptomyces sp. NPDC088354]|uniref:hypothetical protein n=1 Tax=unclassified Streptomyces TaxID=2593676 RepID=UPI0029AA11F5|nr:hypothetical protein [Streptomyces sp. MI02-7b]MDX3071636.1 hypothetical protein [Streptomyces sp. MI02-7b]
MTTHHTGSHDSHVDVMLTDCAKQDAGAVLGALEAAFPTRPGESLTEALEPRPGAKHPTVWSASVDTRSHGHELGPVHLDGTLTADLSGGPRHVREVKKVLGDCFELEEQGSVSGDQEVELRVRLTELPDR